MAKSSLTYSEYLKLDKILSAQKRLSENNNNPAHDEFLFIIVHQVYELWFRQILHELDAVREVFHKQYVDESNIGISVKRLERIVEIQKLLIDQLQVLETMTPLDFLEFRDLLSPASGFQSFQFRLIENKLGILSEQRLNYQQSAYYSTLADEHQKLIKNSEKERSLFDLIERWLERTPFLDFNGFNFWRNYKSTVDNILHQNISAIKENRELTEKEINDQLIEFERTNIHFTALFDESKHAELIKKGYRRLSYKGTQAALLIFLYRDEPILHLPFNLLTTLVEIDEMFTAWRHRHALMVHRMIGVKAGTGGSSGYRYLKHTTEQHKIFSDLANLSTFLISRSELPELPVDIKKNLGFYFTFSKKEK